MLSSKAGARVREMAHTEPRRVAELKTAKNSTNEARCGHGLHFEVRWCFIASVTAAFRKSVNQTNPPRAGTTSQSKVTPEPVIAARLGLTRVMTAALRADKLTPQVDYVLEGRRVMITDAGYVALRGLLGCPESPEEEKTRQSQSVREPEVISLVITSLRPPKNPHIIEAKRPGSDEILRVRVRDNRNFLPGMEIRARQDEHYPDVFVLVGRTPRYRGRW